MIDCDFTEGCQVSRCRGQESVIFAGVGLCWPHWKKAADGDNSIVDNLKGKIPVKAHKELVKNHGEPGPIEKVDSRPLLNDSQPLELKQDTIVLDTRTVRKKLTSMFGL